MSDWNLPGTEDGGDPRMVIAEYVLGLTDPVDRVAIERAIAANPEIAAEARFWEEQLAQFNAAYRSVTPPAGTLSKIEERLFGTEAPERKPRWYDSLLFWRAATGIALAAALIGIGLNVFAPTAPGPGTELVTALQPVESDLSVLALYEPDVGQLRLTAQGTPAGADNDYELWLIVGEDTPISLGTIELGAGYSVAVREDLQPLFDQGITLAVTLEQAGGSPTGAAQGPLVSAGSAIAI